MLARSQAAAETLAAEKAALAAEVAEAKLALEALPSAFQALPLPSGSTATSWIFCTRPATSDRKSADIILDIETLSCCNMNT